MQRILAHLQLFICLTEYMICEYRWQVQIDSRLLLTQRTLLLQLPPRPVLQRSLPPRKARRLLSDKRLNQTRTETNNQATMNLSLLTREPRLPAVETAEDAETEADVVVVTEVAVEEADKMEKSVEEDAVREVVVVEVIEAEEVEVAKMVMESLIDLKARLVKKLTQWTESQVLAVERETSKRVVTEKETGELTRVLLTKDKTKPPGTLRPRILKTEVMRRRRMTLKRLKTKSQRKSLKFKKLESLSTISLLRRQLLELVLLLTPKRQELMRSNQPRVLR